MMSHLSDASLIFEEDGDRTDIIGQRLVMDLSWAYGLTDTLDIAIDLPVILIQDGFRLSGQGALESGQLADARLMARQHLWTSGQSKPWNLSALVGIEIPTGSPEDYSGQDGAGVQFGFSTDGHIGEDLKLNGQLGYAVRPETHLAGLQLGDELLTGVGLTYQAFESGPVIQSEAKFWFPAADLGKSEATSGDLNLGLTWSVVQGHDVTFGAGFGVLPGVGSPGWRGFWAIGIDPTSPPSSPPVPDMIRTTPRI